MSKLLTELMGFGMRLHDIAKGSSQREHYSGKFSTDVYTMYCDKLKPLQQSIVKRLIMNRQSLFVSMPTGGGKTLPILCTFVGGLLGFKHVFTPDDLLDERYKEYFVNRLKKLERGQFSSRMYMFVPIKALTNQYLDELSKGIANVILSALLKLEILPPDKAAEYSKRIANQLIFAISSDGTRGDPKKAAFFVSTLPGPKKILKLLERYPADIVVIDEAHLIFKTPRVDEESEITEDEKRRAEEFEILIKSAKRANPKVQIVMLTGTVNSITVNEFCKLMKLSYNIDMVPIIGIGEQYSNPASLKVIAVKDLKRPTKLIEIGANIVKNKDCGNVFVLFSKNKIEQVAEAIAKSIPKPSNPSAGRTYSSTEINPTIHSSNAEISDIQDPTLRALAEKGIGIITSDTSTRDRSIIASLFSMCKLPLLIGTDAIGLGLNLNVKNIYIPEANKFEAGKIRLISHSMFKQISNRAGRGYVPVGFIITDEEYAQLLADMLVTDVDPVVFAKEPELGDVLKAMISRTKDNIHTLARFFRRMFSGG